MTWSYSHKITFWPSDAGIEFTTDQKAEILTAMQTAYGGSITARIMFDNWFDTPGNTNTIEIKFVQEAFRYNRDTRQLEIDIDPLFVGDVSYINETGRAVKRSLLDALIHEIGHALNGTRDPDIRLGDTLTDYLGDNQRYVNRIWNELGLEKEISYIGQAPSDVFRVGYQYTNGAAIDTAVYSEYKLNYGGDANWDSSPLGLSRDLLIGGLSDNILSSGAGDDFLCGGSGDDMLIGGADRDTAVYFGSPLDYDIKKDPLTGSWSVRNVRGAMDAGSDTLQNMEVLQFDGGRTFNLAAGGLTFQNDLCFVIDTTGSMGGSVNWIQDRITALIDAAFANDNDARIGIVGFKDTTNGEASQVLLPFTDQDDFAARKSAAIAVIDNMVDNSGYGYGSNEYYSPLGEHPPTTPSAGSITFDGGGDGPETPFDGLQLALDGSMGQWRFGAGTLRIVLFTDSPAKDEALADRVTDLAQNIGATIGTSSFLALAGGSIDTFNLSFSGGGSSVSTLANDPAPATAKVQIFTIFTGALGTDTAALSAIASDNGGAFLTSPTNDELVKELFGIINPPQSPTISVTANDPDAAETTIGENPGQFTLTRTGDLTQSLIVAYTLSDTATNGTDYQTLPATVTFDAGQNTATIALTPIDDRLYEGNEAVTLTLADGGTKYQLSSTAQTATVTITDNETKPTISIANVTQSEGTIGTTNYAFNLTLSNPSVETVTVKYTTADGTATAVSDYIATTGTVTFNPGETSKTVNISVEGDTTLERDETFTVNLTDPVGGTISQATGIGTILDDDRPVIALTAADTDAAESKKDSGQFNLTRTGTTTKSLTVNYTIAGTATNDTDYKNLTGTATFKAGSSQTTIEIKPIDDKIYEGNETVILTLNDGGIIYRVDPTATNGIVTITDDDLPSIYLRVTDDKAAETTTGQPNNPGQFTIKRTGSTTNSLTVNYSLNGTASNGIDYQELGTSITFAAGTDTATIEIKPIDDQFFEGTETVILKLSTNSNYTIEGDKNGTVKISDNDNPRDRDSPNLVLKVETLDDFNPRMGTGLQRGLEGEVIDLHDLLTGQTLKVDTIAVSDAGYNNYIGFYAVTDTQGTLASGLKVGDFGYAEAAIKSAVLRSSQNETLSDRQFAGGSILAPVVIANGTFEDYLNRNPQNQANSDIHAYFNYIGANTDRIDHFRLLGDNKFGVEDMYGGGDKDYNDIIFQMNVKS